MLDWLNRRRTAVIFSTLSLLLFLERAFLDFRYVSLEMEGVNDIMPFTAPYMAFALLIIGGWMWALLVAVQGSRGALIVLLLLNLLSLVFGVSTVVTLCPTPCQTAFPITDIVVWLQNVISLLAVISTVLVRWNTSSEAETTR